MSKWTYVDSTFTMQVEKDKFRDINDWLISIYGEPLNYRDIDELIDQGIFYSEEFDKDRFLPCGDEGSLIMESSSGKISLNEEERYFKLYVRIHGKLRDSLYSIGDIMNWFTDKSNNKDILSAIITINENSFINVMSSFTRE